MDEWVDRLTDKWMDVGEWTNSNDECQMNG